MLKLFQEVWYMVTNDILIHHNNDGKAETFELLTIFVSLV